MSFDRGNPFHVLPAAAAAVAVLCTLGLLLLGLPVLGLGGGDDDGEEVAREVPVAYARVVEESPLPAWRALTRTFAGLPEDWDRQGELLTAASVPHPLSCVELAPAVAMSQTFLVEESNVQATVAAWPAGVGAAALARMVEDGPGCAPSALSVQVVSQVPLGVEGHAFAVSGTDAAYDVLAWRRGDVVAFVAGTEREALDASASALDEVLARELAGRCAEQGSEPAGALRNQVHAGADFTGRTRGEPVRTTPVDWPELPADLRASGVEAIQVPGPASSVLPVVLPAQPGHPVWPPLPEPVAFPELPPDVEPQRTEAMARQRIPDPTGPGCGWDFAATMEPEYVEQEVRAVNTDALRRTRAALVEDGARWQREVLDYWVDYAAYVDAVAAYRSYADEVARVSLAWDEIAADWADYERAMEEWRAAEQARTDLVEAQTRARERYAEEAERCQEWLEEDPISPEYVLYCPPTYPAVLDEEVPPSQPEPEPPADPRPAGQR
ncbi:hypothetical protein [Nocardioides sp. zg-DK7169]|uniref:hypothetical protein n=1 Tax=Nocardioides sp. zg-DK7169 TaxID=2736600 RepID=UPI00155816EA|nr:hypothetical protein [Nocardioides sp. zg-DK7169]NPC96478.1 hypothetical protein [Nocardioides sp. zg-DK7169]